MKKLLFSVTAILFSVIAFTQTNPTDCNFFRTGNFSYRDTTTGNLWEFKRTSKHQLEKNMQTGVVIKYKISWPSACEYKLTQVWTNDKERRNQNQSWLVYSIASINENTYTYRCHCNDGTKVAGVIVKLRY
jgi:hypothetical protein